MTHSLCTVAAIRAIEQKATQTWPPGTLMARAGLAIAEQARLLLPENGKTIWLFAGPGNNGGDAFEAAVHLKSWFYRVHVIFDAVPAALPADAREAHAKWLAEGGACTPTLPAGQPDLAIDGLLGIGLSRPVEDVMAERIAAINQLGCPVLAIDIPSGLGADTGKPLGACVRATATITFIARKPGLYTGNGKDYAGDVILDTLGIDASAADHGRLIDADAVRCILPRRSISAHKGNYGAVGLFGGAPGMIGAIFLAGRAALKTGAGKVFLGMLDANAPALDPVQPELMLRMAENLLNQPLQSIAIGPGLGQSPEAAYLLLRVLESHVPVTLDADALNLIAADETLAKIVAVRHVRHAETLMTPHPGEAARLLGTNVAEVEADRIAAARALAQRFNASVVLKGAGSVIAHPGGGFAINTSGNPGMASAGMGDVLTGIIAALLAQGAKATQALELGVWLHGAAADALVMRGIGPTGLTASEVTDAARNELNLLLYKQ